MAGAEKEFRRAIELNQSYATAHLWYGEYFMVRARLEDAAREVNRALETNSRSPVLNLALAYRDYYGHRYDAAIEQAQKTLALDPSFVQAHVCLGRAYEQKARYAEAIAEFRKALDLSQGDSNELAALGHAYAIAGQPDEARKILAQLKERSQQTYVQPMWIAVIHIGLREFDQAHDWFEKAWQDRSVWLVYLQVDPVFDNVRSELWFDDVARRVGL